MAFPTAAVDCFQIGQRCQAAFKVGMVLTWVRAIVASSHPKLRVTHILVPKGRSTKREERQNKAQSTPSSTGPWLVSPLGIGIPLLSIVRHFVQIIQRASWWGAGTLLSLPPIIAFIGCRTPLTCWMPHPRRCMRTNHAHHLQLWHARGSTEMQVAAIVELCSGISCSLCAWRAPSLCSKIADHAIFWRRSCKHTPISWLQ